MPKRHKHLHVLVLIVLVDEDRASGEQLAVAFKREVHHRIEQRVARCNQHRLRPSRDLFLVEADPAVSRQHRIAPSDEPVAIAHARRHAGDFRPSFLANSQHAAGLLERGLEERADVMGLKSSRRGPLHLLPHALHGRWVEPFAR